MRNKNENCIMIHFSYFVFTFIDSLKVVLINMIVFFVKPTNLLTPGLFKIMRPGYVIMTS